MPASQLNVVKLAWLGREIEGSGFLAAPSLLVTCAHVALGMTISQARDAGFDEEGAAPIEKLPLVVPSFDSNCTGRLHWQLQTDLAVFELESPLVGVTAVPLVRGLRDEDIAMFSHPNMRLLGYRDRDNNCLDWQISRVKGTANLQGTLSHVQIDAGLHEGMSGGPALLRIPGGDVCIGLAFLGGSRAAASSIQTSDAILTFLGGLKLQAPPLAIPVSDIRQILRSLPAPRFPPNGTTTSDGVAWIRNYLRRLTEVLGSDLMQLSGVGVELPQSSRLTMTLQRYEPKKHQEAGFSEEAPDPASIWSSTAADMELLEAWSRERQQPLLIMAPFGAGKSVLLAAFAVRLAEIGLAEIDNGRFPGAIPWPVRLRNWISFREGKPGSKFSEFMWSSVVSLLGREDDHAESDLPSFEAFDQLLQQRHLVPMFDGFDELPDEYSVHGFDPADARTQRNVLRAMHTFCKSTPFLLTSRPGPIVIGKDDHFPAKNQHLIRELTRHDIYDYFQKRFLGDPLKLERAKYAANRLQPKIGRLLRRPLFLAAWCDLFSLEGEPPKKLVDLMTELVVSCFDGRRKELQLSRDKIRELLPHLTVLIHHMSQYGYGTSMTHSEIEDALGTESGVLTRDRLPEIRRLAIAAGFVVEINSTRWYAVRAPVTEFLAASHLIRLATGATLERQHFVRTFQRRVWDLAQYDCFDIVFAMLDEGGPREKQVAESCVKWLFDVSAVEHSPHTTQLLQASDDMAIPFVFAAIRWSRELSSNESFRNTILVRFLELLTRSDRILKDLPEQLPPGEWDRELVQLFIAKLIEAHGAAEPWVRRSWKDALWVVSKRLEEDDAAHCIMLWINNFKQAAARDKCAWKTVIRGAANRVTEEHAGNIAQHLIDNFSTLQSGDHEAWSAAKDELASRAKGTADWEIVNNMLMDLDNIHYDDDYFGEGNTWSAREEIIRGAAIVRGSSERLIQNMQDEVHYLTEDHGWGGLIEDLSGRVSQSTALTFVETIIAAYRSADASIEPILKSAITNAAARTESKKVANRLGEWILMHRNGGDPDRNAFAAAIEGLAKAAEHDTVEDFIALLIKDWRPLDGDYCGQQSKAIAIEHAAKQINQNRAATIIENWVAKGRDDANGDRGAWLLAIETVVRHIGREHLNKVVGSLAKAYCASILPMRAPYRPVLLQGLSQLDPHDMTKIAEELQGCLSGNGAEREFLEELTRLLAFRLDAQRSDEILQQSIENIGSPEYASQRKHFISQILKLIERIPPERSVATILQLINLVSAPFVDASNKYDLMDAIARAANRVSELHAPHLLDQLLSCSLSSNDGLHQDVRIQLWSRAISYLVYRLNSEYVDEFLPRCIARCKTAEGDERVIWRTTVWYLSSRISADRSADAVDYLIEMYNSAPEGENDVWIINHAIVASPREQWIVAVWMAASCSSIGGGMRNVREMIKARQSAVSSDKRIWSNAIKSEVLRLRDILFTDEETVQLALKMFLEDNEMDHAIDLARRSYTHTIISVPFQVSSSGEANANMISELRLRRDPTLLFDRDFSLAPSLIRNFMNLS